MTTTIAFPLPPQVQGNFQTSSLRVSISKLVWRNNVTLKSMIPKKNMKTNKPIHVHSLLSTGSAVPPRVRLIWWGIKEESDDEQQQREEESDKQKTLQKKDKENIHGRNNDAFPARPFLFSPMNINLKDVSRHSTTTTNKKIGNSSVTASTRNGGGDESTSAPVTTLQYPIHCSKKVFLEYLKDQGDLKLEIVIEDLTPPPKSASSSRLSLNNNNNNNNNCQKRMDWIVIGSTEISYSTLKSMVNDGKSVNQFLEVKDLKGNFVAQLHAVLVLSPFLSQASSSPSHFKQLQKQQNGKVNDGSLKLTQKKNFENDQSKSSINDLTKDGASSEARKSVNTMESKTGSSETVNLKNQAPNGITYSEIKDIPSKHSNYRSIFETTTKPPQPNSVNDNNEDSFHDMKKVLHALTSTSNPTTLPVSNYTNSGMIANETIDDILERAEQLRKAMDACIEESHGEYTLFNNSNDDIEDFPNFEYNKLFTNSAKNPKISSRHDPMDDVILEALNGGLLKDQSIMDDLSWLEDIPQVVHTVSKNLNKEMSSTELSYVLSDYHSNDDIADENHITKKKQDTDIGDKTKSGDPEKVLKDKRIRLLSNIKKIKVLVQFLTVPVGNLDEKSHEFSVTVEAKRSSNQKINNEQGLPKSFTTSSNQKMVRSKNTPPVTSRSTQKEQNTILIDSEFEFSIDIVNDQDIEKFLAGPFSFKVVAEKKKTKRKSFTALNLTKTKKVNNNFFSSLPDFMESVGILRGEDLLLSESMRQVHQIPLWQSFYLPSSKQKKTRYFGALTAEIVMIDQRFDPSLQESVNLDKLDEEKEPQPLYLSLNFCHVHSVIPPPDDDYSFSSSFMIHLVVRMFPNQHVESPPVLHTAPISSILEGHADIKTNLSFQVSRPIPIDQMVTENYKHHPLFVEIWSTCVPSSNLDEENHQLYGDPSKLKFASLLGICKVPVQCLFSALEPIQLNATKTVVFKSPLVLEKSEYPVVDLLSGMNRAWLSCWGCVGTLGQVRNYRQEQQADVKLKSKQENQDSQNQHGDANHLDKVLCKDVDDVNVNKPDHPKDVSQQQEEHVSVEKTEDGSIISDVIHTGLHDKDEAYLSITSSPSKHSPTKHNQTDRSLLSAAQEEQEGGENDLESPNDIHIQLVIHRSCGLNSLLPHSMREEALIKGLDTQIKFSPFPTNLHIEEQEESQLVITDISLSSSCPEYNHAVLLTIDGYDSTLFDWIRRQGRAQGHVYARIASSHSSTISAPSLKESNSEYLQHGHQLQLVGKFEVDVSNILDRVVGIRRRWVTIDPLHLEGKSAALQISLKIDNALDQGLVSDLDWNTFTNDDHVIQSHIQINSVDFSKDTVDSLVAAEKELFWLEFKYPHWHTDSESLLIQTFKSPMFSYNNEIVKKDFSSSYFINADLAWHEHLITEMHGSVLSLLNMEGIKLNLYTSNIDGVDKLGYAHLDLWDSIHQLIHMYRKQKRRKKQQFPSVVGAANAYTSHSEAFDDDSSVSFEITVPIINPYGQTMDCIQINLKILLSIMKLKTLRSHSPPFSPQPFPILPNSEPNMPAQKSPDTVVEDGYMDALLSEAIEKSMYVQQNKDELNGVTSELNEHLKNRERYQNDNYTITSPLLEDEVKVLIYKVRIMQTESYRFVDKLFVNIDAEWIHDVNADSIALPMNKNGDVTISWNQMFSFFVDKTQFVNRLFSSSSQKKDDECKFITFKLFGIFKDEVFALGKANIDLSLLLLDQFSEVNGWYSLVGEEDSQTTAIGEILVKVAPQFKVHTYNALNSILHAENSLFVGAYDRYQAASVLDYNTNHENQDNGRRFDTTLDDKEDDPFRRTWNELEDLERFIEVRLSQTAPLSFKQAVDAKSVSFVKDGMNGDQNNISDKEKEEKEMSNQEKYIIIDSKLVARAEALIAKTTMKKDNDIDDVSSLNQDLDSVSESSIWDDESSQDVLSIPENIKEESEDSNEIEVKQDNKDGDDEIIAQEDTTMLSFEQELLAEYSKQLACQSESIEMHDVATIPQNIEFAVDERKVQQLIAMKTEDISQKGIYDEDEFENILYSVTKTPVEEHLPENFENRHGRSPSFPISSSLLCDSTSIQLSRPFNRSTSSAFSMSSKPPLLPSSGFLDWYKKWKELKENDAVAQSLANNSRPAFSRSLQHHYSSTSQYHQKADVGGSSISIGDGGHGMPESFKSQRDYSGISKEEKDRIHKIFSSSTRSN